MRVVFDKFIESMVADGTISKVTKICYNGKGVSLNDYYSSSHWSARHSLKKKYLKLLFPLMDKELSKDMIDKFGLYIFYNSRHDPDNVVGTEKIFMDMLKTHFGVIIDDSKKYYKSLSIIPDDKLETNTFEFYLTEYASI
jgi:hypothetical protein